MEAGVEAERDRAWAMLHHEREDIRVVEADRDRFREVLEEALPYVPHVRMYGKIRAALNPPKP